MNQTPRVSWPLRHRGRLACTRSLERRTAGCVLFVTCYLLPATVQWLCQAVWQRLAFRGLPYKSIGGVGEPLRHNQPSGPSEFELRGRG